MRSTVCCCPGRTSKLQSGSDSKNMMEETTSSQQRSIETETQNELFQE